MAEVGSGTTAGPSAPDGDEPAPTMVGATVIRWRRTLLRRLPYLAVGAAAAEVMTFAVLQGDQTDAEAFAAADCYVRAAFPSSKEPAVDAETTRSKYRQMWTTCGLPDPPPF